MKKRTEQEPVDNLLLDIVNLLKQILERLDKDVERQNKENTWKL